MGENIKEILKDILAIMKEELAAVHIYTECTGDYTEECKKSSCSCACKCSHSKELYDKLSSLEQKLELVDSSNKEMDCLVCNLGKEKACPDCCRDWNNEEED